VCIQVGSVDHQDIPRIVLRLGQFLEDTLEYAVF
jgi:hypothetical protein